MFDVKIKPKNVSNDVVAIVAMAKTGKTSLAEGLAQKYPNTLVMSFDPLRGEKVLNDTVNVKNWSHLSTSTVSGYDKFYKWLTIKSDSILTQKETHYFNLEKGVFVTIDEYNKLKDASKSGFELISNVPYDCVIVDCLTDWFITDGLDKKALADFKNLPANKNSTDVQLLTSVENLSRGLGGEKMRPYLADLIFLFKIISKKVVFLLQLKLTKTVTESGNQLTTNAIDWYGSILTRELSQKVDAFAIMYHAEKDIEVEIEGVKIKAKPVMLSFEQSSDMTFSTASRNRTFFYKKKFPLSVLYKDELYYDLSFLD